MTVGDPRKAKVLAVVAVGAIAFTVIELLPGTGDEPRRAARKAEESVRIENGSGGQLHLQRDPFSSALLVKRTGGQAAMTATSQAEPKLDSASTGIRARLHPGPWLDQTMPIPAAELQIGHLPTTEAKEQAGGNRAKVTGDETVITLQATMRIDDEVAMISVGHEDAKEFRQGSLPAAGVRVALIDSDGVTLQLKGRQVRVSVGQAVRI